ncbi:MAG: hypothetical protein D8H91_03900, partial [Alloprevotella sp.]
FRKISRLSLLLLLTIVAMVSCNRVYEEEQPVAARSRVRGVVTFDTRAQTGESINRDNADYEDRVNKIRLIICLKGDGDVVHNAVHPLADLTDFRKEIALPTGEYEFFFVANETPEMTTALDGVYFREALFRNLFTRIPVSNPLMERVDQNVGIPMTARLSGTVTANHKSGNALRLNVKLMRTLAKLTLNIQRALQTAGAQKGQPTDDAAPVTLSKIRIAYIPTDYPLFVAGGFRNPQGRFEQTITTNISPDGAKKITRTFYLPESVSETFPGAIVYFTFSKHGEEKEVALIPKIRDINNLTVAGYNDGVRGVASLGSIVRNVHYVADVEVKGWEENVANLNWTVQPWEKETSTKDFIPAVVENAASNANNPFAGQDGVSVPAGHPNWVDLDPAATDRVTFKFKVKKPEGAHWRFTLTNNLDFEFVDESSTYGTTSDNTITFAVRARKPYTGTMRTTELYLTVDGKEVQIVKGFNANNVGPTKRILIRQTS